MQGCADFLELESSCYRQALSGLRVWNWSRAVVAPAQVGPSTSSALSRTIAALFCVITASAQAAGFTNFPSSQFSSPSLPDTGPSLLRVLGALSLVLGLFLAGAWLVRNGRIANFGRSRSTRLRVLESRSLGARQALYVVAYGEEQFLIGSTPAGINLLSHLAPHEGEEEPAPAPSLAQSFPLALAQVLRGQKPGPDKNGGAK